MEDFVDELGDTKEAGKLRDALNRRKPFRQFKDTLHEHTNLSDAWYAFEQKELKRLAEEWCKENGICNPFPNISVMSKLSGYMSNALRFGRSSCSAPSDVRSNQGAGSKERADKPAHP